jgi:hypothetical protein
MTRHSLVVDFLLATILVNCVQLSTSSFQTQDEMHSSQSLAHTRGGRGKVAAAKGTKFNAQEDHNGPETKIFNNTNSILQSFFAKHEQSSPKHADANSAITDALESTAYSPASSRGLQLSQDITPTQASLFTDESQYYEGELIDVTFTMNPTVENLEDKFAWIGILPSGRPKLLPHSTETRILPSVDRQSHAILQSQLACRLKAKSSNGHY